MKKTLVLIMTLILTFALAIPSFAAVWNYPGFMVDRMTDASPSYTAANYPTINVQKGTPVIDGKLDDIYKNGVSITASNWSIYGDNNKGQLPHEADLTATAYFLWDDGYFYTCIVVNDGDISTIGRDAILDCYPSGNPWMNDGIDQFFTRTDGSSSFKIGCDAYCILPYFSDWALYSNFQAAIDGAKAAGRYTDDIVANGGWWQGDCIGGMWWVEGDLHPYWAEVDNVVDAIDWKINENPQTVQENGARVAKSRTSTFASTQGADYYIIESAIRMPECKSGFDFMYGYQVIDTDSKDEKFLALTNVSSDQFKNSFHMVMTGGNSGSDTTPSGNDTTPVTTPSGDVVTTPSGDVVTTPSGDKVTKPSTETKNPSETGNNGNNNNNNNNNNNPSTADIFSVAGVVAVAAAACFVFAKKKH